MIIEDLMSREDKIQLIEAMVKVLVEQNYDAGEIGKNVALVLMALSPAWDAPDPE